MICGRLRYVLWAPSLVFLFSWDPLKLKQKTLLRHCSFEILVVFLYNSVQRMGPIDS
jgi:hypothetical protein